MRRLNITVDRAWGWLLATVLVILKQSQKLAEVRQQRDTALQSLRETQEALRQSQFALPSSFTSLRSLQPTLKPE